jgi:hypothetical protein
MGEMNLLDRLNNRAVRKFTQQADISRYAAGLDLNAARQTLAAENSVLYHVVFATAKATI